VETPGSVSDLGRGKPLSALPKARHTHALVFYGKRWDKESATAWCKMNGYNPKRVIPSNDRIKFVQNAPHLFVNSQFALFTVCKDVKLIVGRRMSRNNERRAKRHLSSIYT
jgi:hypothetical protein